MAGMLRRLGLDRMTVAERIALAQEILDSVAVELSRPPRSEAKRRKLDRQPADQAAKPAAAGKQRKVIRVGDKIRFDLVGKFAEGKVLEDRGLIGLGGRHLYTVRYELGEDNGFTTELPAEKIEVIESKKPA